MFSILQKKNIAEDVYYFEVNSTRIAEKRKAGQFVIVQADKTSERIPLTIVDSDPLKGTFTLIFQTVGKSSAGRYRTRKTRCNLSDTLQFVKGQCIFRFTVNQNKTRRTPAA